MFFTIEARHYNALLHAAPEGGVRYYLNGIYVDAKAGRAVATDGHVMLTAPIKFNGGASSGGAKDSAIYARTKMLNKHVDQVVIDTEKDVLFRYTHAGNRQGETKLTRIDGRFPDWEKILRDGGEFQPKGEQGVTFNPTLVAPIAKALARHDKLPQVELYFRGRGKPAKAEFPDDPDVTCIFMTMT